MRILHVFDHSIPLHSGYAFRSRAILQHQRALGLETYHITGPKQGSVDQTRDVVDGLEFYRTRPVSRPLADAPVLGHVAVVSAMRRRLETVTAELKPDILHAHSPVFNGMAALKVGRRFEIPVLYEVRAFWEDAAVDHGTATAGGLRYRLSRALESYVLRRADAVTVICDGLRQDILKRGIPPEKITVIPNAVDLHHFPGRRQRDPELARRLGLEGCQTLGFIGSFYTYEGISLLLEAFSALLNEHKNVRILLVGGGPQDERLKRQARDLGISEYVVFTGRVAHDEVQSFYDLVDIFVYPRVRIRLTELVTPLKPLEAMAQGALVVASDVGGHLELIEDGKTGTLFEAGNPAALVRALSDILNQPERWKEMSQRAREFVATKRTWRLSVSRYLDVYRSMVKNG